MKINVFQEITFITARSGGKGGQHVNKVETMVIGYFDINNSKILSPQQKSILDNKFRFKMNAAGLLFVKSQATRSQLENKWLVIDKINLLIEKALIKPQPRIATKPSFASKQKRIEFKKKKGEIKGNRKKIDGRE